MKLNHQPPLPQVPAAPDAPGKPREMRCDAKLHKLNETERDEVLQCFDQEGWEKCAQRIDEKYKISISRSSIYAAVRRWRAKSLYREYYELARAHAEAEAKEKGNWSLAQIEEATDRRFIVLASKKEDPKLYRELRYLRIADQTAKSRARVAEAKVEQGARKLQQGDKALELAERRVILLEKKIEEVKEVTANDNLSIDERSRRVREILGL